MTYKIDKQGIATTNPKVDLTKVEEVLATRQRLKSSGVLTPKNRPELVPARLRKRTYTKSRLRSHRSR
mgnify:CR=1 FL=1